MQALVIGGGIIGLSSAYYLQQSGWDVTLLEKTDLSDGCSYGNLGMIVPSHFVPLAAPGMLTQGIKWMFDNKSPFYVRPSFNPSLISWGIKFLKNATPKHLEASANPLLQLSLYSKSLYDELANETGFDFSLERKGILMYFKTEKFAEEEIHLSEKARSMGLDAVPLNKQQVQQLEPDMDLDILGAIHYRCDAHLYPNKLIPQLIQHLVANGVQIKTNEPVIKIVTQKGAIKKVISTTGEYNADMVVMTGGSWLRDLAKLANINISLMPGKGYSFTDFNPLLKLNIPAILCEARVAITPMNGYMRYGGTMEIAPVNTKIHMNRVLGIVQSIPQYFTNIKLEMPAEKNIWYGFRPCSPDGLPYIGFPGRVNNLIIAGAHAMMGLSLGPATGKIVADLANGRVPEVDIKAFDPGRFS
ncbi:MAG: FAD-dependent oxidoreductase [Chitinophagaceae bacterium]